MGRGNGDVDTVSLIDLTAKPPRTVETISVPSGPEPMKFSPDGNWLAVGAQMSTTKPASDPFHHDHGLLTVFAVQGDHLQKVATAPIGPWAEGIAFSRDGHTILVQSMKADRGVAVGWPQVGCRQTARHQGCWAGNVRYCLAVVGLAWHDRPCRFGLQFS
jgi:hypothetical protein